jgi:hypothetical protein
LWEANSMFDCVAKTRGICAVPFSEQNAHCRGSDNARRYYLNVCLEHAGKVIRRHFTAVKSQLESSGAIQNGAFELCDGRRKSHALQKAL